jgi:hypothetical protein
MSKKAALGEQISAMVAGLKTSLPSGTTSLPFEGQVHQVSDLVTALGGFSQLWTDAETDQARAHKSVLVRDEATPSARALFNAVKRAVRSLIGETSPDLLNFGLKPRKSKKVLTTDERSDAQSKLRSTRTQNKTMGKQQKKAARSSSTPPSTK